jgi:mannosyl-3-phosphoglycerate phosphatase
MTSCPPIVVFSDLDGTLLDAETHSAKDARGALDLLADAGIPLVFCSSKTRAEIELLQEELGVRHPFICENGGGVFVPARYFAFALPGAREVAGYQAIEFGRPYAQVVEKLHTIARRLAIGIVGFSDMSVDEVARECRLSLMRARLAKLREYDEPFRLLEPNGAARSRLVRALHAAHLTCTDGGRYDHAGAAVDKGLGVHLLSAMYRRVQPVMATVGLGDAANDAPLLSCVDRAFIIRSDSQAMTRLLTEVPTARVTGAEGVSGWAEAIGEVVRAVGAQRARR